MPISNTSYSEQSTLQRRAVKRKQMLQAALERQKAIRKVKSLGHADYRQGRAVHRQALLVAPTIRRSPGFSIATGLARGSRSRVGAVSMGKARTMRGIRSKTSVFQSAPGGIYESSGYRWTTSGHVPTGPALQYTELKSQRRRRPASFLNLRHRMGTRTVGGAR